MTAKSLAVATVILACGGCKNSGEALTGDPSHKVTAPQSRAMARSEVESVCSDYCSEFRIHEVTLNKEHDGSFEVSGRVPVKQYREFDSS